MRTYVHLVLGGLMVLTLSGCGTITDDYRDGYIDGLRESTVQMKKYYLVDADGYTLADVPYYCTDDDGRETAVYVTDRDGSFAYYPSEQCTFDLEGLDGWRSDPIFIEDAFEEGVADIPYQCALGEEGFSHDDGFFRYVADDVCTLYL